MLKNVTKHINLFGYSQNTDGTNIAQFSGSIDSERPDNAVPSRSIINPSLYRANRTTVRADQAKFEDQFYALVDEIVSDNEMAAESDTTTTDTTTAETTIETTTTEGTE